MCRARSLPRAGCALQASIVVRFRIDRASTDYSGSAQMAAKWPRVKAHGLPPGAFLNVECTCRHAGDAQRASGRPDRACYLAVERCVEKKDSVGPALLLGCLHSDIRARTATAPTLSGDRAICAA